MILYVYLVYDSIFCLFYIYRKSTKNLKKYVFITKLKYML